MNDHPRPDCDELPLEVEQPIDRLGDELELAWKSGYSPHIVAMIVQGVRPRRMSICRFHDQ